jgi:hypothetical protein
MSNTLITVDWVRVEIDRQLERDRQILRQENARRETLVLEFLEANPGAPLEDLIIEHVGDWLNYSERVRLKTSDEKWLEWMSDNHGWEKESE